MFFFHSFFFHFNENVSNFIEIISVALFYKQMRIINEVIEIEFHLHIECKQKGSECTLP